MKRKYIFIIPLVIIISALMASGIFADDGYSVTVSSVELNPACDRVTVHASVDADFLAGHEGADIALMEMKAWNGTVIPADTKPVATAKLNEAEFTLSTGFDVGADRYDSFIVAIKDGAGYTAISDVRFIDDPAVLNADGTAYPAFTTKKGLISDDLSEIVLTGSAQTVIDVAVDELLLPGYASRATSFVYCGNTYYLDGATLDALDRSVRFLNDSKVNVFARIYLSGKYRGSGERIEALYYADSPDGSAYALNASSDLATTSFTAVMDFLAHRYGSPSGEDGFIGSWIVGRGADTAATSLRTADVTVEKYVESYQRALRITDTAVRSVWKNARVYVPVSNDWNSRATSDPGAKSFLTSLAACVKKHGDIPWRVAVCARASDPSLASVWTDAGATDDEGTKYVTVKNIGVLLDFLASDDMLYNGEARNAAVTDFAVNGSPDSPGDMNPAASFAYAYFKTANNARVDALIWSVVRDEPDAGYVAPTSDETGGADGSDAEKDESKDESKDEKDEKDENKDGTKDPAETTGSADGAAPAAGKLYMGLCTADGVRKQIYEVFTKIDAALIADPNYKAGDTASFALSLIGVPDWTAIDPSYDKNAAARRDLVEAMPILSSDISGRVSRTSTFTFDGGIGSFYPVGAEFVELRTATGKDGGKTALLYAGLPANGGSYRAGVACLLGTPSADARYISFQIYVEAPTDVASVAVNVVIGAAGAEGGRVGFTGSASVKPNSWQEVTFRCDDVASRSASVDTLDVFVSSYDGTDHEGSWGMMIDDLVTYGAAKSRFGGLLKGLLFIIAAVALVFVVLFIIRARNVRRARKRAAARRNDPGRNDAGSGKPRPQPNNQTTPNQ